MREIPSDVDVVVVGGGQAGLGMSYRLREAGISHADTYPTRLQLADYLERYAAEHGVPRHERGVAPVDGVYWIGLPWQTRLDSSILHGVDADGRELTAAIVAARGTDAPRASASMGL